MHSLYSYRTVGSLVADRMENHPGTTLEFHFEGKDEFLRLRCDIRHPRLQVWGKDADTPTRRPWDKSQFRETTPDTVLVALADTVTRIQLLGEWVEPEHWDSWEEFEDWLVGGPDRRVTLRLSQDLAARVREAAQASGLTQQEYLLRVVQAAASPPFSPGPSGFTPYRGALPRPKPPSEATN
jgi:hypothetical protein